MGLASAATEVVRTTVGRCDHCHAEVPAEVVVDGAGVALVKCCPAHGNSVQRLSGTTGYWEELDRYFFAVNREPPAQRDYIVRMTERCNLQCPICLARANTEDTPDFDLSGLERLLSERRRIKVDLMAAEPTLRDDLEDWIRRIKARGHIAALHTNGLRLAKRSYAERVKAAGVDEVFLQFDGFDDDANRVLRGRPLLKARTAALANLRELDIATSLIVVIGKGLNEGQVEAVLRFAARPENHHIREVFFMGLRHMGAARDQAPEIGEMALMPDDLVDILCAAVPEVRRADVRAFNKVYFALLSLFGVRKCLYIQHYLVAREGGGLVPVADLVDLERAEIAADAYAADLAARPRRARARLVAELARAGLGRKSLAFVPDLLRLNGLLRTGMNLADVPRRLLLIGFITACDTQNYDAAVARHCGKGELSVDHGFQASSADANVLREARWALDRESSDV